MLATLAITDDRFQISDQYCPNVHFFEMHKPLPVKVLFGMRSVFDFNDDAKTMCRIIGKLHSILPDFRQRWDSIDLKSVIASVASTWARPPAPET